MFCSTTLPTTGVSVRLKSSLAIQLCYSTVSMLKVDWQKHRKTTVVATLFLDTLSVRGLPSSTRSGEKFRERSMLPSAKPCPEEDRIQTFHMAELQGIEQKEEVVRM